MNFRTGLGIVACLLTASAPAQVSVGTAPVGVLSFDVPVGLSGMSCPLIPQEITVAGVVANTASDLTFSSPAGAIGSLLASGGSYYVEILSGPSAGERYDVDVAATIAAANSTVVLALDTASHSTSTPANQSLAGASAALRAHVTLATVAALFSPALTGSDDPTLADGVRLYAPGGFVTYYLRADGATWTRPDDIITDQRSTVIPPDVSIVLELKSGPRQFVQMGTVRTTVFRKNLQAGYQAFATGFPVDLSATQAGALVDIGLSPVLRWAGSNNAAQADTIEVYEPALGSFIRYYLRADGTGWRRLGRTENFADATLLRTDSMIVVRRSAADATYRIAPPFSL